MSHVPSVPSFLGSVETLSEVSFRNFASFLKLERALSVKGETKELLAVRLVIGEGQLFRRTKSVLSSPLLLQAKNVSESGWS